MKVNMSMVVYKDKPLWDTAARGQKLIDLSNKNHPEVVAHEAEKLFLKLLKEIQDEKNKKAKENNRPRSQGRSEEKEEAENSG